MFVILQIFSQRAGIESWGLSLVYSPVPAGIYSVMDYKESITSAWHENLHLGDICLLVLGDICFLQKANDFLKTKLMENFEH